MADFDDQQSPPPPSSSSSEPPPPSSSSSAPPPSSSSSEQPHSPPPQLPAAGKRKDPPTVASTSSTAGPSPNKRPNIPQPPPLPLPSLPAGAASSGDVKDTATSEPLDIDLDDLEILQRIVEHRDKKGHFPFENPDSMNAFLLIWTTLSFGTEEGLKKRIEKLEKKYNMDSQPVEEEAKKEFDLWMKIWGKEGGDDHDPTGGAGAVGV
ncbi:hypothetical protein OSB04_015678 [Centaurea solstitialis]|uniref:Glabrous enhancer-binding protein-like DBD domain-containing protein n=1 Tax=Centaurea solstitialis TaxID=347529 RepID=A0AA38TJI2_9ASTR|nr:hypothetical protein OSB04_015678 [Centaurea solstitialis]